MNGSYGNQCTERAHLDRDVVLDREIWSVRAHVRAAEVPDAHRAGGVAPAGDVEAAVRNGEGVAVTVPRDARRLQPPPKFRVGVVGVFGAVRRRRPRPERVHALRARGVERVVVVAAERALVEILRERLARGVLSERFLHRRRHRANESREVFVLGRARVRGSRARGVRRLRPRRARLVRLQPATTRTTELGRMSDGR
eukprot:30096-Pelagococcus_subviridis.AAC.2